MRMYILLLPLLAVLSEIDAQESCTLPQWTGCQQIIIDTDGGGSDCVAILKLLYANQIGVGPPIRAITIVNGFTNVNQGAINVGKTLSHAGRTDIPFYIGANEPLVPPTIIAEPILGADGFGDFIFNGTIPPPSPEPAPQMLVSLVDELGDNAILITLGPLTNLALAYKLDNDFFNKLKTLHVAAGSVKGFGIILPGRQLNVYLDPYAFKVVLTQTNYQRATLYPLDIVFEKVIEKAFWDNLPTSPNNYVEFAHQILRIYRENYPNTIIYTTMVGSASVIYPQVFSGIEPLRVDVVTSNEGRGVLLVDYANKDVNPETSNFNVVQEADIKAYRLFNVLLASS